MATHKLLWPGLKGSTLWAGGHQYIIRIVHRPHTLTIIANHMDMNMDTDTDTDTDTGHEQGHSRLLVMCSIFRILHSRRDGRNERLSDCKRPASCQLPHAACHMPPATCYLLPASCKLPAIIILNNTYKSLSCLTTSQTSNGNWKTGQLGKLANWQPGEMALTGWRFS